MDPKAIVREGYDRLGERYLDWAHRQNPPQSRAWFLDEVLGRIPRGADVLELGCGPGVEASRLGEGRRYTGVDLSPVQLGLALARFPAGRFLRSDLTTLEMEEGSFDAAVSFYVFNHVPRDEQGPTFLRIASWLRAGGVFCASLGAGGHDGMVERDWLGIADMYFAANDVTENERLIREAGFDLELSEVRDEDEAGQGTVTFHWVIGRRRPS